jgi:8-oxo-dGTP pyrophosphatase MutT (NUDIX family)
MDAALREAGEETGLDNLNEARLIGVEEKIIKDNSAVICTSSTVYARPDVNSFDWCVFRRGITVKVNRKSENGFTLVTYLEYDNFINPTYISYQITGWVSDASLAKKIRRYFYHIEAKDSQDDYWKVFTDNHTFKLFWTPIDSLPKIVTPQDQWVDFVRNKLNYRF